MINHEELENISMQIILCAGDARQKVQEAFDAALRGDYGTAQKAFDEADSHIQQAHIAQTDMIQKSLEDEKLELPNLLFIHAQDTLMTIMSEVNMSKNMVSLLKTLKP